MPVGFLITAGLVPLGTAASLWPPVRSGPPGLVSWLVSTIPSESPFLAFYWMAICKRASHCRGMTVTHAVAVVSFRVERRKEQP
jgi:hypothetical protein